MFVSAPGSADPDSDPRSIYIPYAANTSPNAQATSQHRRTQTGYEWNDDMLYTVFAGTMSHWASVAAIVGSHLRLCIGAEVDLLRPRSCGSIIRARRRLFDVSSLFQTRGSP